MKQLIFILLLLPLLGVAQSDLVCGSPGKDTKQITVYGNQPIVAHFPRGNYTYYLVNQQKEILYNGIITNDSTLLLKYQPQGYDKVWLVICNGRFHKWCKIFYKPARPEYHDGPERRFQKQQL